MSTFRLTSLAVENFRCFERLDMKLEQDITLLFAENAGGKTALLTALAMGLAIFQRGSPKDLRPDAGRDPRMITLDEKGRREPAGACVLTWSADAGSQTPIQWTTEIHPASGRIAKKHRAVLEAIEQVRVPGERWPLFAWYGVDRLARARARKRPVPSTADRWAAYESSLDPALSEGPLLEWLLNEVLADAVRQREGEPQRFLDKAVLEAAVRAVPGVTNAWYDPAVQSPVLRFETGQAAPWSELSDGYHVFIALVTDIARRAVILNESDGGEAPQKVEGVVLIDEIDLHLHPRWQRVVLAGLRETFPKLQFILSTHSPQVLSSAENRQVKRLVDGRIQDVSVEGRDSNAILRELMNTNDRDPKGHRWLKELYDAIDRGDREEAQRLYDDLVRRWKSDDAALIRAKGYMDWEE